jgi:hypothetical protein
MFSEKEEARESSSPRFTNPATVVIEIIQLDVQRSLI